MFEYSDWLQPCNVGHALWRIEPLTIHENLASRPLASHAQSFEGLVQGTQTPQSVVHCNMRIALKSVQGRLILCFKLFLSKDVKTVTASSNPSNSHSLKTSIHWRTISTLSIQVNIPQSSIIYLSAGSFHNKEANDKMEACMLMSSTFRKTCKPFQNRTELQMVNFKYTVFIQQSTYSDFSGPGLWSVQCTLFLRLRCGWLENPVVTDAPSHLARFTVHIQPFALMNNCSCELGYLEMNEKAENACIK